MRSVFVFPAGERAETVASLDRHLPAQRDPLQEIKSGAPNGGHGFFDFRAHHELHRELHRE
ncbi:hypothetical protein [Streptomyces sp. NPDC127072]|uniref:hypothetical protein n=1 Tax=Streptomyces sp. NPDC127072 TaxID=3347129 RepID=UPI0036544CF5